MTHLVSSFGSFQGTVRVGVYPVDAQGNPVRDQARRVICFPNRVLFGGSDVVARLLGGDSEFKVGAMYFEFENLASPSDPISAPAFDRSGGLSYFQSLPTPKDYLRVPIVVGPTAISSDITKFQFNQITFFALTSGSAGVLGRTFDEAANSTVYGVALAATPVLADPTQDIVFARAYFPDSGGGENKFLKEAGAAIGVDWAIRVN